MAIPEVDKLYDCAQKLSAAKTTDMSAFEDEYKTILAGVKGGTKAKMLSSQFIARFFAKFPKFANTALDAILDLCEDGDVNIRKQAIKDLPSLCREMKEFLPKIADVLSQLLQTDDASEMVVIQNGLVSLFRRDPKGTLVGLFSQVRTGGDLVRERALRFLHAKITSEGGDLLPGKDAEAVLLEEVKNSIEECTADEFHLFMAMLGATSLQKTVSGQSMLVELIAQSSMMDKDFDPDDDEAADRFIQCGKSAVPFFSSQVKSSKFMDYLTMKVLPLLDDLDDEVQTQMLKLLAEMSMFTGAIDQPLKATQNVYKILMAAVPCQPTNGDATADEANFEFTKLECLLLAFHTVAQQAPKFLADDAVRLKEFKTRLQYFALAIQGYIRKLDEYLKDKTKAELAKDDNQVKVVAHRSAKNINALIKDLFHVPPSYKSKIVVSWRPPTDKVSMAASRRDSVKRKSITFQDDVVAKKPLTKVNKKVVGNAKVYTPPQGKYSAKLDRVVDDDNGTGNGYEGRFRGRGRGRGRGWTRGRRFY